jgi:hypothetical protein
MNYVLIGLIAAYWVNLFALLWADKIDTDMFMGQSMFGFLFTLAVVTIVDSTK